MSAHDRPAAGGFGRRWMMALSLLLAVITWYAIREATSFETVVPDVPLEILHDTGWAVLEQSDDTLDIRFRGARADLEGLARERLRVVVDVQGKRFDGARTLVRLGPENVRAPAGVRAVAVIPDELSFSMDREGERHVPVKAEMQDEPPQGIAIEKTLCVPATVLLRGPLSKLQEVDVVRTEPVELEGRVQSFKTRRSLLPPPGLTAARLDPNRVMVEVTLAEHADSRQVEGVPVRVMFSGSGSPGRMVVEPERVAVDCQGRAEVLGRVTAEQIRAFVDVSDVQPGARYELPVQTQAPPGVRVVQTIPPAATVTVGGP